jgi:hypothetical protein
MTSVRLTNDIVVRIGWCGLEHGHGGKAERLETGEMRGCG